MSHHDRGFTFIETLTYGAGIVIILGGVVMFLFYLYNWYRAATVPTRIDTAALAIINQITTDLRASNSLNDAASIYNQPGGKISMTTISGTNSTTTAYSLDKGAIVSKVNNLATTTISAGDIWVSGFYVRRLVTPNSVAVRIDVRIDYSLRGATTTNAYTDLAILRQSY